MTKAVREMVAVREAGAVARAWDGEWLCAKVVSSGCSQLRTVRAKVPIRATGLGRWNMAGLPKVGLMDEGLAGTVGSRAPS